MEKRAEEPCVCDCVRGIFFIWSLFSSGNSLSCHTVVERFQTMNDFEGNVWVVIEKTWHKKMF